QGDTTLLAVADLKQVAAHPFVEYRRLRASSQSITLSPSGTRVVFCPTSGAPLQVWDAGADKVTQIVVDGQRLAFLDEDTLAALSTYPSGFDMFAITVLSLKSPLQRQTTAVAGAQGRVEPQISGWIDPPAPEDTSHR